MIVIQLSFLSLFSPRVAALQVDYIPYLDFLAQEVSSVQLSIENVSQ